MTPLGSASQSLPRGQFSCFRPEVTKLSHFCALGDTFGRRALPLANPSSEVVPTSAFSRPLGALSHNTNQGDKVKPTGRNVKPASTPKTGIFALLRGLLLGKGSGLSKISSSQAGQARSLVVLCALAGLF